MRYGAQLKEELRFQGVQIQLFLMDKKKKGQKSHEMTRISTLK